MGSCIRIHMHVATGLKGCHDKQRHPPHTTSLRHQSCCIQLTLFFWLPRLRLSTETKTSRQKDMNSHGREIRYWIHQTPSMVGWNMKTHGRVKVPFHSMRYSHIQIWNFSPLSMKLGGRGWATILGLNSHKGIIQTCQLHTNSSKNYLVFSWHSFSDCQDWGCPQRPKRLAKKIWILMVEKFAIGFTRRHPW